MIRTKSIIRNSLLALCAAGLMMAAGAQQQSAPDTSAFQKWLDSAGLSRSDLDAKVMSTLMYGGSSPVSFSGEGRFKLQYHQFSDYPAFLRQDKSYVQSNWEGNESAVRVAMVARAGRNTVLYSKIGFQHTMPGNYINPKYNPGDSAIVTRHDKTGVAAIIHEDMGAGMAVRTVPASFWVRMGAIEWIEASPLTVWKSQPRTFAWEYLPFEVEQPIARYFEYNIAKGEKTGRAAWNKKAFQGINIESINLPGNLYFNFLYGIAERYDNCEREYDDFSNDLALADLSNAVKGQGLGDTYRHIIHSRLAANELFGKVTPSLNFMTLRYDENIINDKKDFQNVFGFNDTKVGTKAFFKEPIIGSFALRGPINDKFSIHTDVALSRVDTTWFKVDSVLGKTARVKSDNWNSLSPAIYAHLENKYGLPINADIAYISREFYSPLSFAAPVDAFFPFGANLLGPGKFLARGEASPYAQNMTGINLQYAPALSGYGHLRINYGQHMQIDAARDNIYFPYRLNGQDMFSFIHSSYTRWGNDLVDHTLNDKYIKRLGDESYKAAVRDMNPVGFEGGGLRSDYLAMFEGFVPYENINQARANSQSTNATNVFYEKKTAGEFFYVDSITKDTVYDPNNNAFIPVHQKFTFNLEADWALDISPMVGYSHDMFVSVYGALNGVSTSFVPVAFNDKAKDMLLWGTYVRMEPAIALSNKFYILGLAGFENWRSQKAYANVPQASGATVLENRPIDYRDYALGIGFDWDMLARVGLHGRFKYMQHDDITLPINNYKTPVISTEIKMWF